MRCALLSLALLASMLCARPARAGGGPETTLIVVNEDSPASLYIAGKYAAMRNIPDTHICRLRDMPNRRLITIDQFRERIWKPIAAYMKAHNLETSIDCIAYSTGFPFGVDFNGDFAEPNPEKRVPRHASLNSMTFLARRVMEKDNNIIGPKVNRYCRFQSQELLPSHGFRSHWEWNRTKDPIEEPDLSAEPVDRYWLSVLLGLRGLQRNSPREILTYLRSGTDSDASAPKGSVYLMLNKDIRSRTRQGMFDLTLAELGKRKRRAFLIQHTDEGQDGTLPKGKGDVFGLVAGKAGFDWAKSGSTMLKGAIAEHLTSFGGRLDGSGQTKLTAFLRAGAVGSSGTVAEPLALAWKFPTPFLHVHYADGCSLAEAFYQSVSGPYQLLIVGDPLARPFAKFQKITLPGVTFKEPVTGPLQLQPHASDKAELGHFEYFVDGRLVGRSTTKDSFTIDTTKLDDGPHELRVIGIEFSPIATRSSSKPFAFRVANGTKKSTLKGPRKAPRLYDAVKLSGRCGRAKEVQILHGNAVLAVVTPKGSSWKATIPSEKLGRGEHLLTARAIYEEGPAARSRAFALEVKPPARPDGSKPGRRRKKSKKKDDKDDAIPKGRGGLQAEVTDSKGKTHSIVLSWIGRQGKNHFVRQLRNKVKGKISRIRLTGEMRVPQDGIYTLAFHATGDLTVKLHGRTVFAQRDMVSDKMRFAEVSFAQGWQPIEVEYAVKGNGDLAIALGGAQVTQLLNPKILRY